MTTKHTPGPWRESHDPWNNAPLIVGPNGETVVGIYQPYPDHEIGYACSDEDARLIVAAPDLLDAAREALDAIRRSGGTIDGTVEAKLEAAITKAEGRS